MLSNPEAGDTTAVSSQFATNTKKLLSEESRYIS